MRPLPIIAIALAGCASVPSADLQIQRVDWDNHADLVRFCDDRIITAGRTPIGTAPYVDACYRIVGKVCQIHIMRGDNDAGLWEHEKRHCREGRFHT